MKTAYGIAFKDGQFLMVFNSERKGWEMPGGHVELGETTEEAVKREFIEESGYLVDIVASKSIGHCEICACKIVEKISDNSEMESRLFYNIPKELFFDIEEYELAINWARSFIEK